MQQRNLCPVRSWSGTLNSRRPASHQSSAAHGFRQAVVAIRLLRRGPSATRMPSSGNWPTRSGSTKRAFAVPKARRSRSPPSGCAIASPWLSANRESADFVAATASSRHYYAGRRYTVPEFLLEFQQQRFATGGEPYESPCRTSVLASSHPMPDDAPIRITFVVDRPRRDTLNAPSAGSPRTRKPPPLVPKAQTAGASGLRSRGLGRPACLPPQEFRQSDRESHLGFRQHKP